MTDQNDTTSSPGPDEINPADAQDTPDYSDAPEATTDDKGSDSIEARKYRQRAQKAESERDTLAARLEAVQRAEITRLTTDLAEPSDLWTYGEGLTLDELTDDDGQVDPALVEEAQRNLIAKRPGLARAELRASTPTPLAYRDGGQGRPGYLPPKRGKGWSDVIAQKP